VPHNFSFILFFSVLMGFYGCNPVTPERKEQKEQNDKLECEAVNKAVVGLEELHFRVSSFGSKEFSELKPKLISSCKAIENISDTLNCQDRLNDKIDIADTKKKCIKIEDTIAFHEEYLKEVPYLVEGDSDVCKRIEETTMDIASAKTSSEKVANVAFLCSILVEKPGNYRCRVLDKRGKFSRWDSRSRLYKEYCSEK
jgi:hypothetical protein